MWGQISPWPARKVTESNVGQGEPHFPQNAQLWKTLMRLLQIQRGILYDNSEPSASNTFSGIAFCPLHALVTI